MVIVRLSFCCCKILLMFNRKVFIKMMLGLINESWVSSVGLVNNKVVFG